MSSYHSGSQAQAKNQLLVLRSLANIFCKEIDALREKMGEPLSGHPLGRVGAGGLA